jgi:hypothetical protein
MPEQHFNWVLKADWISNLLVSVRNLRWIDETISLFQVHQHFEVNCMTKEVFFKLGGMHIFVCLQNDVFEGLIHIDTVGVDAPEFVMKACCLGRINGVGTSCNDGVAPGLYGSVQGVAEMAE